MIRIWIEFDHTIFDNPPAGTLLGVGITHHDEIIAINVINKKVFNGKMPPIKIKIIGITMEELDKNHVIPNMGDFNELGIWFPLGY